MIEFNLDLLSVGITAAGIGILGFTIFFNNTKSITNKTFLAFSLITIFWSIANYLQYQPSPPLLGLWIVRAITFLGSWHAFTFFTLCLVFPKTEFRFMRMYRYALVPLVALTSILTLTPLVFKRVLETSATGVVTVIENGPAIPLFGILSVLLIGSGIALLIYKTVKNSGIERKQVGVMMFGTFLTFVCIVTFNLVLPAAFNNPRFLPLSALFIFPFIACTAYAIFRYRMLNVKVLTTEIVAFLLSIATLVEIMFSTSGIELLFRASVFGLVLGFSIMMVQSVIKEVRQRELIQAQEEKLELANRQQESLLHFISHEVKGYLTKNLALFAAIADGDFGVVPQPLGEMSKAALADTRKGVETVIDILDASNLKSGTVSYAKTPFDFAKAVDEVVRDLESAATEKGITLSFTKPVTGAYVVEGDESKLRHHVLRNIIDNSIKYTPQGSVTVELSRNHERVRLTVSDTGVGITPEDKARLFTEGGHGKDSIKVNVHSTGYGLYIAKQVLEAHGGTIRAESEGAGKGSRFIIELPTPPATTEPSAPAPAATAV